MDDDFCDPLELRGDSLLGIPGLVQAVRSGHVAIANALGSGLMESAAHMAFLPLLSRQLLGEELRIEGDQQRVADDGEQRHQDQSMSQAHAMSCVACEPDASGRNSGERGTPKLCSAKPVSMG